MSVFTICKMKISKKIAIIVFLLLLCGCSSERENIIQNQREKIASLVRVGDNIHEAKEVLLANGFKIIYGPEFMTEAKTDLIMIIDYGLTTTDLDGLKYSVGLDDGSEPITGAVEATPKGVITRIE